MAKHCPKCLVSGIPSTKFCSNCGTKLVVGKSPAVEEQEEGVFDEKITTLTFEAISLLQSGLYVPALKAFQQLVQLTPESHIVWHNLLNIHLELGNNIEAVQCFEKYREIAEDFIVAESLTDGGFAYIQVKDFNKAIEVLKEAIQKKPDLFHAHNNLATCYFQTERYDDAIKHFIKTSEINPEYKPSFVYLTQSYMKLKASEKAIKTYERALELFPKDVELLIEFARIFMGSKDYAQAKEIYEKILEIDENFWEVYVNLGVSYAELGNFTKGIEVLEKAMKINPTSSDIIANLVLYYFTEGRIKEAVSLIKKTLKTNPNHPKIKAVYKHIMSDKKALKEAGIKF